jgi:hypothetical protein
LNTEFEAVLDAGSSQVQIEEILAVMSSSVAITFHATSVQAFLSIMMMPHLSSNHLGQFAIIASEYAVERQYEVIFSNTNK